MTFWDYTQLKLAEAALAKRTNDFEPCEQIGGDTFNFQYSGRNHISFYMLDVCGHGVSSALISAAASQFLQTNYELSANASEAVQPEAVLNRLESNAFTMHYRNMDASPSRR